MVAGLRFHPFHTSGESTVRLDDASHSTMPDIALRREELRNVVTYIMSLTRESP
jgi:hypothetical protein